MLLKGLSKSKVGFKASDKLKNELRDRGTKIMTPCAAFGANNVLTIHSYNVMTHLKYQLYGMMMIFFYSI